jgi:hypothetical protein
MFKTTTKIILLSSAGISPFKLLLTLHNPAFTEFLLLTSSFYTDSLILIQLFWSLRHVDVSTVAEILEVHSGSIFMPQTLRQHVLPKHL